jgi:hypothetical protein
MTGHVSDSWSPELMAETQASFASRIGKEYGCF